MVENLAYKGFDNIEDEAENEGEHSNGYHSIRLRKVVLSSIFNYAIKSYDKLNISNPAKLIDLPEKETTRKKLFLSVEESKKLVSIAARGTLFKTCKGRRQGGGSATWEQSFSLPRTLPLALTLGLRQGLRVNNILNLKWKHIKRKDGKPDYIKIHRREMKNKRQFITPLHSDTKLLLIHEFKKQKTANYNKRVLSDSPQDTSNFRNLLMRIAKVLSAETEDSTRSKQLKGIHPHVLRYSFGNQLGKIDPSIKSASILLGHHIKNFVGVTADYLDDSEKEILKDPSIAKTLNQLPSILPEKLLKKSSISS
jgi:integrase